MCEGFLRIEMHALLHWFLFLERKEDARNSERISLRGSKMLLQTNPMIIPFSDQAESKVPGSPELPDSEPYSLGSQGESLNGLVPSVLSQVKCE